MAVYALVFYLLGSTSIKQDLAGFFKVQGVSIKAGPDAPITSPDPANDIQENTIIASSVKLCSNATYGFQLSYPNDWFSTYNTDDQKCYYFAPFSFTVPADTDIQFTPIILQAIKPEDWGGTQSYYQNPNDFQNVNTVENLEIAGRSVQKIMATQTGKGTTTKGFAKMSFLIQDAKNPIVISYQQQDAKENPIVNEKILEDMARSLIYF